VLSSIVKIVPQQTVYVIERFGMYQKTLLAGLHFVIPFVDKIAYIHSIKEIPMDVQPQICITKDNTQVTIDGILYYKITDPKLASYGTSDFRFAIEQLAKTTLRSEVGKRELDRLLEERQTINFAVVSVLDEASEGWGVKLIRYEVKDITPPDIVLKTMQLQLTAEREKRAKIAQSEGDLQQQINRANGERQAAIAESEGKKQAVINKAMGDAESIRVVATATAEAISTVAKAITSPIYYKTETGWVS
jgi:regulator of protease activity HflC (stomatin/prohibitin superfamily)